MDCITKCKISLEIQLPLGIQHRFKVLMRY